VLRPERLEELLAIQNNLAFELMMRARERKEAV
jgi:hypothetical protein